MSKIGQSQSDKLGEKVGLVACDALKNELLRVLGDKDVPRVFMEFALHEKPKDMPAALNKAVKEIRDEGAERVVLGYGLCSNGTTGVSCDAGLCIPRCHDCVSMLLGSPKRYMEMFEGYPGTLFYSDGFVRNTGDLLSVLENKYIPRLGERLAWKGVRLEIANYKYLCLIDNGVGDTEYLRKRVKECAKAFDKEYLELKADLSFFKKLIEGPREEEEFVTLGPGEAVREDFFHRNLRERERKLAVSLASYEIECGEKRSSPKIPREGP
jgi:hypothetical protein